MATKDDGKNVTDKNIDDNDNKNDQVLPSQQISSLTSCPSTQDISVAIATSDPGYKDTHPIGSRKVTENVITYHEPIFQSVVNTIYENQKHLNMGKRKADELEKGGSTSIDAKKKKVESPKIDTGFKVKKKCSIENIIERIRSEKTQSRGGSNATGESSEQAGSEDLTVTDHIHVSASKTVSQHTHAIKTVTFAKTSDIKEAVNVKSAHRNIFDQVKQQQQVLNSFVPSLQTDTVLDLSMKSAPKQTLIDSKTFVETDLFPCRPNQSGSKGKQLDFSSNTFKASTDVKSTMKEKSSILREKGGQGHYVKTIGESVVMNKAKKSECTLKKMTEKLKQTKVTQSVMKHVGLKSRETSAIKTNTKKRMSSNVSPPEKSKKGRPSSKGDDNGGKKVKKSPECAKKSEIKTKIKQEKTKKQKVPIAFRRVKREASLNAATLVNILYEKNTSPKLNAKRSKSESDLALSPKKSLMTSHSFTDIVVKDASAINNDKVEPEVFKTPKIEPKSPVKEKSSPKKQLNFSSKNHNEKEFKVPKREPEFKVPKSEPESPKKCKVSINDDEFNEIIKKVLKQKPEASKSNQEKKSDNLNEKSSSVKVKEKMCSLTKGCEEKKRESSKTNKDAPQSVNSAIPKSPEERAERRRKANLARMKKAKELLIAKKLVNAKVLEEDSDSGSESSEESDSDMKDENTDGTMTTEKVCAKKGELCRAARTHVHVEAKTVFENTSVAPQWCECCQSTYYPSQPQQGTKVWRIKQLIDKGTQNPPELIQSASHHFIAAHASCEVRPYSSPTHVSVLDSGPYVAPLMSHGHVTCTACGCRHTGMMQTAQCQGCALLPCQRYSNTYSVSYPHGHSSYQHCSSSCGSCYAGGSFHSPSQPLIHQPQIPMSTETPILVRHTVPLHDTSHSVPLQLSHNDSGIASCQVPLHISDSNIQQISHCCQLSQGEIILRTNSQSDHEFIDVGKDDVVKASPQCSVKTAKSGMPGKTVTENSKPMSKMRKSSASSEIKKGSSQTKLKEKDLKNTSNGKVQSKQKEKDNTVKEKPRKKSDSSSKKKPKASANKEKNSGPAKLNNSSKTSAKGGKNEQTEIKEENVFVEEKFSAHGWTWEGEGIIKNVTNIFDGQQVQRKCFQAIRHEDGEIIHVKDCILVCSGRKEKDIPYVAKVTSFWEQPVTQEMMMTLLWYYRPEHVEGGRRPENQENEVFAAKHPDESLVACIDDRGFVLTYNEFCRFKGEVLRTRTNFPLRKKVVPDPEEQYPSNRIPPVDVDPENVFLCRHVYDLKLKRVLKNPS